MFLSLLILRLPQLWNVSLDLSQPPPWHQRRAPWTISQGFTQAAGTMACLWDSFSPISMLWCLSDQRQLPMLTNHPSIRRFLFRLFTSYPNPGGAGFGWGCFSLGDNHVPSRFHLQGHQCHPTTPPSAISYSQNSHKNYSISPTSSQSLGEWMRWGVVGTIFFSAPHIFVGIGSFDGSL